MEEEEEETKVVDVDGAVSSLQSTFEGGATITLDERDIARAKEVSAFETSIALRAKDVSLEEELQERVRSKSFACGLCGQIVRILGTIVVLLNCPK